MGNDIGPEKVVDLQLIRDCWRKTYPEIPLFDQFGASEIEAYWRSVLCFMGLRLKTIRRIMAESASENSPPPPKLAANLEKIEKELELCRVIGNFLIDHLPASS
jgi:hypothetical protein